MTFEGTVSPTNEMKLWLKQHSDGMQDCPRVFPGVLSVPQNTIMDLNNVMLSCICPLDIEYQYQMNISNLDQHSSPHCTSDSYMADSSNFHHSMTMRCVFRMLQHLKFRPQDAQDKLDTNNENWTLPRQEVHGVAKLTNKANTSFCQNDANIE